MKSNFIVSFEGCIGVGKTTVARLVAEDMGLSAVEESFDTDELKSFYGGEFDEKGLLNMETRMLNWRLDAIANSNPGLKICDFDISKTLLFSKNTLSEDSYKEFKEINFPVDDIYKSDVTFVIVDTLDSIQEKISRRGREGESNIDASYLESLMDEYDEFHLFKCRNELEGTTVYVPAKLINLNNISWFTNVIKHLQETSDENTEPYKVYGFTDKGFRWSNKNTKQKRKRRILQWQNHISQSITVF